ncbi:chemotaxis protein CheW [Psychrobacter sp.]|uniref:chemotaxis protein CheW n=1 Tax=Psychrobacter sp. TaxID=56811 RepID=UPI0025E64FBE|nr:chemotaxis protein CheW [Psychrobacter sp.]
MALKGFIELLRLERLAESRKSEIQPKPAEQWQGIAFEVAGEKFVAPIGEVAEVISVPEALTPVPLSKPWLLGIANIRGQLLPIADLAKFVNLNNKTQQSKLMVIKHHNLQVGLMVDEVWHIKNFFAHQYVAKSLVTNSPFLPYNHGRFEDSEQSWPIFMPSLLIQDPRFLQVAQ